MKRRPYDDHCTDEERGAATWPDLAVSKLYIWDLNSAFWCQNGCFQLIYYTAFSWIKTKPQLEKDMTDAQKENRRNWGTKMGGSEWPLFSGSLWGLETLHTWIPGKPPRVSIHKYQQQKLTLVNLSKRTEKILGTFQHCWKSWRTRPGHPDGRGTGLV